MRKDIRGTVTVFVAVILVPSVLMIGALYDYARYLYSTEIAQVHANNAVSSVLSNYDNLLKETYGIFGVDKTSDEVQTMLTEYYEQSVSGTTAEDGLNLEKITDSSITLQEATTFADASDLLYNEICDYYKYWGVVTLVSGAIDNLGSMVSSLTSGDTDTSTSTSSSTSSSSTTTTTQSETTEGILDIIDSQETSANDTQLLKSYNAFAKKYSELGELYRELYYRIEASDTYDASRETSEYEAAITNANTQMISLQAKYATVHAELEALEAELEELEKSLKTAEDEAKDSDDEDSEDEDSDEEDSKSDAVSSLEKSIEAKEDEITSKEAEQQTIIDAFAAQAQTVITMREKYIEEHTLTDSEILLDEALSKDAGLWNDISGKSIKADTFGDNSSAIETLMDDIEDAQTDLYKLIADVEADLKLDVDETLRTEITATMADVEDTILEASDITLIKSIAQSNLTNEHAMANALVDATYAGTEYSSIVKKPALAIEGSTPSSGTYTLTNKGKWKIYQDETGIQEVMSKIYDKIIQYDDEDAEKIDNPLESATEQVEKDAESDETAGYMGHDAVSDTVWNSFFTSGANSDSTSSDSSDDSPKDFDDLLSGSLYNDDDNSSINLSTSGVGIVNKAIYAAYLSDMFSNISTGLTLGEDTRETVTMTSGVEMSADFNYYYTAEQEFLLFGLQSPTANLAATTASIFAIRAVPNLIFTYQNTLLKSQISTIALGISATCPFLAPYSEIIVRTCFVTMETVDDIIVLKSGGGVDLLKTEETWRYMLSASSVASLDVSNLDTDELLNSLQTDKGDLSYSAYLGFLIYLKDTDKLVERMSFLISINLSNYMQGDGENLTSLEFNLNNCVGLVSASAQIEQSGIFLDFSKYADSTATVERSY